MNMPATHIANASSPVSLCAWYLARALTEARAIKASATDLVKVKEHLAAARRHYTMAKARGASADVLAQLAADGHTVAAEVKAAEGRVSERAAQLAAKAAERAWRLRLQRQYILRGTTAEAARCAAREMVAKGRYPDPRAAMAGILAETVAVGIDPKTTTPEHILEAWMILDPA